ncbi:MAG: ABC transporter permease subunit [Chloroflexi bacterium]|nr:ABC transporter permease subunit [Chloroflexota bacterium]
MILSSRLTGNRRRIALYVDRLGILIAISIVVLVWSAIAAIQPPKLFPPIRDILAVLYGLFSDGSIVGATLSTVRTIALGSVLALVIGLLGGFALRSAEGICKPLVNVFQSVPPVIWSLFALIWFGESPFTLLAVITAIGFPIVALNAWEGLKSVDVQLTEMAASLQSNRTMMLRHVVMPSLVPYLMAGVRVMVGFAWKASILAELLVRAQGIGFNLYMAWSYARTAEVLAWTLWLAVLMWTTEYAIIRPVEAYLTRWKMT